MHSAVNGVATTTTNIPSEILQVGSGEGLVQALPLPRGDREAVSRRPGSSVTISGIKKKKTLQLIAEPMKAYNKRI